MAQTALTIIPKASNIVFVSIELGKGDQLSGILLANGYRPDVAQSKSIQVSDGSILELDCLTVSASSPFSPEDLAEVIINSGILSR